MREILFRGQTKEDKKWIYGNLLQTDNGTYIIQNYAPLEGIGKYEVDPETVCQYTGLTDKNGRKIFEGDIVKLPKCENDIAVFALRGCNYFLKGKHSNYELGNCDSECFEVIGNIFDNPELIGDQP